MDLNTIALVSVFQNVFVTAYLFIVWLPDSSKKSGIRLFHMGTVFLMLGNIGAFWLRKALPPLFSTLASNALIVLATVCMFDAFKRFLSLGKDRISAKMYALPALVFLTQYLFTYPLDILRLRVIFVSLSLCVPLTLMGIYLIRQTTIKAASVTILCISFFLQSFIYIVRIGVYLLPVFYTNSDFINPFNVFTAYIWCLSITVWPIGIALVFADFRSCLADKRLEENIRLQEEIKTLKGIIPICSYCKKIRNDQGAWENLEEYISSHSQGSFSHGICPHCFQEHNPEHIHQEEEK